jgi:hypothetical protein
VLICANAVAIISCYYATNSNVPKGWGAHVDLCKKAAATVAAVGIPDPPIITAMVVPRSTGGRARPMWEGSTMETAGFRYNHLVPLIII